MTEYLDFYLQDGQTESNVSLWRKRLREAPSEVLSVCASIEKKDAGEEQRICVGCGMLRAVVDRLHEILSGVERLMRQMPRSASFFASAEDRRSAFWRVCHFLTALEEGAGRLREETGMLTQMWEYANAGLLSLMQNESILRAILLAAEEEAHTETASFVRTVLRKNEQIRQHVVRFETILGDACRMLAQVSEEDVCAFCEEIAKASDLEHAGQDALPTRVLQILEDYQRVLLRRTEQGRSFLTELEET